MSKNKLKKIVVVEGMRTLLVVGTAFLYALAIVWFLNPAKIYAGGLAGLGQLLTDISKNIYGVRLDLGLVVLVMNIPVFIISVKHVSIRFAGYSMLSILCQTLFLSIVPEEPAILVSLFHSLDPASSGYMQPIDLLLFAVIGGFITGLGAALALRFGTSTGGLDMVGQALALRKNMSIGYFTLIFNCLIALIAAIVFKEPSMFFYTIVRIIITSVIMDRIHTAYNFVKLEIVTTKGEIVSADLMQTLGHGITISRGIGAYTHNEKDILHTVILSYEIYTAREVIKRNDGQAFVTIIPVKGLLGYFKRRIIA